MKKKDNHKYACPIVPGASFTQITDKDGKTRICKPDHKLKRTPHTAEEVSAEIERASSKVIKEFKEGLRAVHAYPKSVTFFGSARFKQNHPYYKKARHLATELCREGYAVITGGGPGIMEAGNRGTNESCGSAVGFNIELPYEQVINKYVTHGVDFHYFFTRKVALTFSAEVYVYFPGGYGTLDELFEILTLIQTKKIERVPVLLIGSDFWGPLDTFIKNILRDEFETISPGDIDLYQITDDLDQALQIIKNAPTRNHHK